MNNTGIILTLAYPETIVMVSDEWFAPYLHYIGVGKKNYVRAGHAALVLIHKESGAMNYYDFGRYITPKPHARVRCKITDCELDFKLSAEIENGEIKNLKKILKFLATNPRLTHGKGKMVASVCDAVDYDKATAFINKMKESELVKYAAFGKKGSNCSRFVTDSLIASVTDEGMRKRLLRSKTFTPSTVGNALIANTKTEVFQVSQKGEIQTFNSSIIKENIRCFLDRLKGFEPSDIGNLQPKPVEGLNEKAQWLSGIGGGAWFELHQNRSIKEYRFRRISPYGNVDVDDIYVINDDSFDYDESFEFIQYSNCEFFHLRQNNSVFRFERIRQY